MTLPDHILNVLIIDDEIEACENLQEILLNYVAPEINIMGFAHDTDEAEKLIKELKPNAVFCDIELPTENALQFLSNMAPFDFEVVFVTAYDEFAIKAFKLNAVDYILKPIDIDEVSDAVARLKEKVNYRVKAQPQYDHSETFKQIATKEKYNKITLRAQNQIEVVDFKDIYFIEGQGSYCRVYFNKSNTDREITISNTIADYEELLPMDLFYRIHKSYLLNCSHIKEIIATDVCEVLIKSKNRLPVSRRRYASFIDFLKENELL
jgi:two-component system LytT family response regulator